MSIDTDLATAPYYDDYNENKNFQRILFRPAVALQARELNQIQSILQNQIERFGDNVVQQGTIIKGCNFTFQKKYAYVKLLDQNTSGSNIVTLSYVGARAVGLTTGVTAKIVNSAEGLESQLPNLNTIFVKYLTTGNGEIKTFGTTENIEIRNFDTDALITTVSVGGTVDADAVGNGYAVTVSDGIIYQKGTFLRVEEQTVIVEKYTTTPDDLRVGFKTDEDIIDSNEDTSLLDNASGFNNFNAPGAHRLKMTPTLTVLSTAEAEADSEFFSLIDFEDGEPVKIRDTTEYAVIGDTMARRTMEESGDYTTKAFPLSIDVHRETPNTHISAVVGAGLAYVSGFRIETHADIRLDVEKAIDFAVENEQTITTNYGHYVLVDEMMGNFDFNEGAVVSLHDTALDRFTAGSVGTLPSGQIGTANIRSLTYDNGVVGAANAVYRAYLFNIQMTSNASFEAVRSIFYDGTDKGAADIVTEGSPARAVIKDFSFKKSLFQIGREAVKALSDTDFVYRTVDKSLVISAAGAVTITLSDGEWPYGVGALNSDQKKEILLISDETQAPYADGEPIDLSGATATVTSATTLEITGITVPAAEMDIIAYYNVKKNAANPALKDSKTVYIKIDPSSHTSNTVGPYCLGFPDVYEITNIWMGTTYANTETNVTSSFHLTTGQKDTFYALSYIRPKKSLTITTSDRILVEAKVFQKNTSSGDGFFSVDSYYNVDVEDIPVYVSENNERFLLRDTIDFRPFVANTADYALTIAAASINPSETETFGSGEKFFATPNKDFETDYEYYLARKDKIVVDKDGRFKVIQGVPSEYPTPPETPDHSMAIAIVNIPPFPSLTPSEAASAGKIEYATRLSLLDNRGYTMRDIGAIERRLEQIEYYTVLSQLETETRNLNITDENGLDRFKNGILVDPFNDLSIAEVNDFEYNAAIDPSFKELMPPIQQYDIPLKVSSVTNVTNHGNALTLPFLDVLMINQPYGTKFRNLAQDFYQFNGIAVIQPEYDNFYDVTVAPQESIVLDNSIQFIEFTENFNNFVPLRNVSNEIVRRATTSNTNTLAATASSISLNSTTRTQRQVGEFISDIRFDPFMRSREVRVYATGLRPSTRHYFYFDGQAVSQHVANAVENIAGQTGVNSLVRSSAYNPAIGISTDANGILRAIFRIPAETFYVGDRALEVFDVSLYNSRDTATSKFTAMYGAFNASVSTVGVFEAPEPVTTVTREFTQPVNIRRTEDRGNGGGGDDPLAQTFFVKQNYAPDDSVVMVTKVDLYFRTKSNTLGINVMIREVENGFPTKKVVPFSKKYVPAANVNVSETGNTATTVSFNAPIKLETNKEYALVIKPDQNSPDYQAFVSKIGETDLVRGIPITQDWGDGTLFTSTNDRAWTPYQDENLKFSLYRANFTSASGNVVFVDDNVEFLTVNNAGGTFNKDEYVYVNATPVAAETVAVTEGNSTIVGTGTSFVTDFNIGEHIVVVNSSDYDVLEIKTIANSTVMTTTDVPKFSNNTCDYFKSIVGKVYYYNSNDNRLHLYQSTANSGTYFTANTTVVGADSGAIATIESVDDQNITYIQPSILRSNYTNTKTTLEGTFTKSVDDTQFTQNLDFSDNNYLTKFESKIMSRSNEVANAVVDSFKLTCSLSNITASNTIYSSPFISHKISSALIVESKINNDNTDEHLVSGNAIAKYVSRTVELTDGLDAEDLRFYLTAYRPPSSDIEVYVKFRHASDAESIDDKVWTKLTRKSETNKFSSSADRFNFYEYEFNVPTVAPNPNAAFLNTSGVLSYETSGGAIYETYKYFKIKIVMLSSGHHRIPRIRDMRSIALSA